MAHLHHKMNTRQSLFVQKRLVAVLLVIVAAAAVEFAAAVEEAVAVAFVVVFVEVCFWQVLAVELLDSFVAKVVVVDIV